MQSMLKTLLITTSLLTILTGNAEARVRRHHPPPRPVHETLPTPECLSNGHRVNCETWEEEPIVHEPSGSVQQVVATYNSLIVGTTIETTLQPVPPNLSLNTTRHTIEEFNDSRVAGLHNIVASLINDAVQVCIPLHRGRNPALLAEIQSRLDPMADGADPNRVIDRYWISSYDDRLIVYVKLPQQIHILTYTIMIRE